MLLIGFFVGLVFCGLLYHLFYTMLGSSTVQFFMCIIGMGIILMLILVNTFDPGANLDLIGNMVRWLS